MKRILALIFLVSSFACAMDAQLMKQQEKDETTFVDENWLQKLEQEEHSQVATLLTLCAQQVTKQFKDMSLQEFLAAKQPVLPHKLDCLVGSQLLKNNPFIISTLLQKITVPLKSSITHPEWINKIVISPDGSKIVTQSNKMIKIWDIKTSECLKTITKSHLIAISPDCKKIITNAGPNSKIWDIETDQILRTLENYSDDSDYEDPPVTISLDGSKIVQSDWSDVKLFDIHSDQYLKIYPHDTTVLSYSMSSDGSKIVVGLHNSGIIKIYDLLTNQCHTFTDPLINLVNDYHIMDVIITPDFAKLVIGVNILSESVTYHGWGRTVDSVNKDVVKIMDTETGECLNTLFTGLSVGSVAISPDGSLVAGSNKKTARIWDLTKFNTVYNFLNSDITIKQALLLKAWNATQQKKQKLDLSNEKVKDVFDSLPQEIKDIIY